MLSEDSSIDQRSSVTTPTPSGMVTPGDSSSARTSIATSVNLPSSSSLAQRPATPAVLDPPPRTFSLPQPSSRFSDDSFMSDALGSDETPGSIGSAAASIKNGNTGGVNANADQRISVKNFAKLFRSRSKSRDGRDPSIRVSREIPPPVPIPSPQINAPRAPPVPPPPPMPASVGPLRSGRRSPSPVASKSPRPGHIRDDSGSDPFHFDQVVSGSGGRQSSPPLQSPSTPGPNSQGSSASDAVIQTAKKRGILKGWGSSSARPTAAPPINGVGQQPGLPRVVSPSSSADASDLVQRLDQHALHTRNDSKGSSLSARGLRMTHRESWVSIAETSPQSSSIESGLSGVGGAVSGATSSTSLSRQSIGSQSQKSQTDLMAIDEREATEFAAVAQAAQKRRETMSSLRPPVSPSSTESSNGPRASVDEVLTPRSSQFEMMTPTYVAPERI